MREKIHLLAASALALSVWSSAAGAADKKLTMTLLNAYFQDEFWQGCNVGAKRAAKDIGADLTLLDGNYSMETQVNQIDTTIQKAPAAMMIASIDSSAVVPALKRAMARNIQVYAFNTAVPNTTLTATVAMDESATGAAAAKRMIGLLQKRAAETGQKAYRLVHLVGAVATEPVRLRREGFNKVIQAPIEGITVDMVEVVTNWKPEPAVSGLQDAMTRGPVDAIFTESDFLTPFLIPVLKRNGYTDNKGAKHVLIGGLGGIPGGLKAIREGWQEFSLNYPIDGMCASNVYLANESLDGKPFAQAWQGVMDKAGVTTNAPRLIDDKATGPTVLLTANPIDASNVDSKIFWANTYKE
ncbi:sugar ABC transporter substrate-binding protein [Labrys wisconsinensis]|uniref:ABC-type sugar transport system substrate-binding protein n=1 Tax=Labrys wisconsinensis TaxID=425677 RepID=A0ABU0JH26_9HYPH|nr:sugar ABC transporter substrate-binding protein [Labrys wisconsinensis]MDQ0473591.1 ABC-type sugar transport system substrate-binding protein [Labrys wisconsinensis]